jgi:hypothetical protein
MFTRRGRPVKAVREERAAFIFCLPSQASQEAIVEQGCIRVAAAMSR